MDIRTMQSYLAVIREGTISAAAQALHVAQPSLSRQMKELEEELGAQLFVRGNRRIKLTEEGKQFTSNICACAQRAVAAGSVDFTEEERNFFYKSLDVINENLRAYYKELIKNCK